ncbi:transcription termination factor MTEF18, mitochondrial-like [Impatiens glandulifera]|uniref:transcription termination factor MTEF18, mitochondrial-like n=1 Tax=Impatiens glandulifera TaxID=253017 RepID=UPI001FB09CA3|nr:transcription termination factor MTEF18, mitochondrial-like [Impatiens glandulifera]
MRFLLHRAVLSFNIRHFSSNVKHPRLPNLSKISFKHRRQAIQEAQEALTDYLHSTRSLSFTYAEQISKNSLVSLSSVISEVKFTPSTFSNSFGRFLRYHPINEFEFFYESIGINHNEISLILPENKFFLHEDPTVLNAACALSEFGFPWNKLGSLYKEQVSIFNQNPDELTKKLVGFRSYGLNTAAVIGICLVFSRVLIGEDELVSDLIKLIIDFDLMSSFENNVIVWCEVCRKIKVFYDLGCEKGGIGELLGRSKTIFVDFSEEVLVQNVEFFCKLGIERKEAGLFLLERPEIFRFDLKEKVISVAGLLKHFGMNSDEIESVLEKFPYILGRNSMQNLPQIMRALNLNEWFYSKITKEEDYHLLGTYAITDSDQDMDRNYIEALEKIRLSKNHIHYECKLEFLHGIGFGENKLTMCVLNGLHGTGRELKERFDCMIRQGFCFSRLCKMLNFTPKLLNQNSEILEKKIKFLSFEMGTSAQYLDAFPAFLCYDLEKRIQPRYKFHMWLTDTGLCTKNYSLASLIATSEKNFIARISNIHPAAPKMWLECFKLKS